MKTNIFENLKNFIDTIITLELLDLLLAHFNRLGIVNLSKWLENREKIK